MPRALSALFVAIALLSSPRPAHAVAPLFDPSLKENPLAEKAFFTENARRRNPRNDQEVAYALRVPGCTAFLLRNDQGRFYAATARHCFQYQLKEACEKYRFPLRTAADGIEARCRRVVAGTDQDDLAVVEIDFGANAERAAAATSSLRLAAFAPRAGTSFRMVGYPADGERRRRLTVTENCGDNTGHGRDFLTEQPNEIPATPARADLRRPETLLRPRHRAHNCSVYAGNSGGALTIAGTDIAAGIPDAYDNGAGHRVYDVDHSAVYETSAGFVARNRSALRAAGIQIAESPDN